jgi:hypothetical protein
MKKLFYLLILSLLVPSGFSQETTIKYLSGTGIDDAVLWDFKCTKGRKSGKWEKIPVPSNWELHGFGEYNYGHDLPKADEEGLYKQTFFVPADWKGESIKIVFVGSMTDTEVKINSKIAGPVHQGAFYQFDYEISKILKYGAENLLEVRVSKMSSDESVNAAERKGDYWVFGGIFRPVYLKIMPKEHISRVALDPKASGHFRAEIFTSELNKSNNIKLTVKDLNGEQYGETKKVSIDAKDSKFILENQFQKINPWSPEFPNIYIANFELCNDEEVIHRFSQKFGFRTVEVRVKDGIYVNGVKIMFRGVNRHSFWPESGRALSKKLSIMDVELMKDMNMNAVRMSHYPPDPHFLDVCDSLGLFVLNELAGWQRPPYNTEIGEKLVKEMVTRDVNHPSIVLWDNGNEGGWNTELDDDFAKYDPQNRVVIHPWEIFNGLDTKHYRSWNYATGTFFNGRDIFFPTEFLHGLNDGGHGAGLEDYWDLMRNRPLSAGGFLWVFSDEGVLRTDKDGWIDVHGNNAPDGIVGPYREKEASFYTIKEIWSPIQIKNDFLPPGFDGTLGVENRFFYTELKDCRFQASWITNIGTEHSDTIISAVNLLENVKPGNKGFIKISLPESNSSGNFNVLMLSAFDPHNRKIMTWQWPLFNPSDYADKLKSKISLSSAGGSEISDHIIMNSGSTLVYISKKKGIIDSVLIDGKPHGLKNGPVPTTGLPAVSDISYSQRGGSFLVNVSFEEKKGSIEYHLHSNSWLEIKIAYKETGNFNHYGFSFDFPEKQVESIDLLGKGPYRVWKNRMKGPQFGYWHKKYNNTITGLSWDYPEFKGYYSDFYSAKLNSELYPFIFATSTEGLFLRLFTPGTPTNINKNNNTNPEFPVGDISFMKAINPIGTKFKTPEKTGPMGQKSELRYKADDKVEPVILLFNFEKEN